MSKLFAQSPDLHCDVLNRMSAGPYVVWEERTTGFHVEGSPTDLHVIAIYRVEGEKITLLKILT